jgi:hypothetical protein
MLLITVRLILGRDGFDGFDDGAYQSVSLLGVVRLTDVVMKYSPPTRLATPNNQFHVHPHCVHTDGYCTRKELSRNFLGLRRVAPGVAAKLSR